MRCITGYGTAFQTPQRGAAADGAQLIIWPEAAGAAYLRYDMKRLDVMDIVHDTGLEMFTGFPDFEPSPPEHSTCILL